MPADDLSPASLERRSTAEVIAQVLRERLLAGEFRPGTPMRESVLAPQLGVSRPTMREALQHLVAQGLLAHHLHQGIAVIEPSPPEVRDVFAVRLVLESAGIRALERRTEPADLSELVKAVEELEAAATHPEDATTVDSDMAFHSALVRLTDSTELQRLHASVVGQLRLILCQWDSLHGGVAGQAREHGELLADLQAGRWADAHRKLQEHLDGACGRLERYLVDDPVLNA